MKKLFFSTLLLLSFTGFAQQEFNKELADELIRMADMDQVVVQIPTGEYADWPRHKWRDFTDSILTYNRNRCGEIFDEYGYPGYDLVGKEGASAFWVMVQHCDFDVTFQKKVLPALERQVKNNNATARHLGLLTDRVKINSGERQLYGTQVIYKEGRAVPKALQDSSGVDVRREAVGLIPLQQYLDLMTEMHREMNELPRR